ncbi:MAG: hypothetical protein ABIJ16_14270 [Bacteroidota bacterium]
MMTIGSNQGFSVSYEWRTPDQSSLLFKDSTGVLVLEFYDNDTKELLKQYFLVPWTDISEKTGLSDADISFIPETGLFCVSPVCIVFEKFINTENDKTRAIEKTMQQMLDADSCTSQAGFEDSHTFMGLQLINKYTYPFYVEMNIALPGSGPIDNDAIRKEFPGKMIRLILQPDYGPVKIHWLKPEVPAIPEFLIYHQQEMTTICKEAMYNEGTHITTQDEYKYAIERLKTAVKKYNGEESDFDFMKKLVDRLFNKSGKVTELYKPGDLFPDYTPKLSPDNMTDFCPAITGKLPEIPHAQYDNLVYLCLKYIEYSGKAKKNPGTWVDGNMILGAKEKEYNPSDEELLLCETSERIRIITENADKKQLKNDLKEAKIRLKKLEYKKFTFTHCDVMGSGRFFYVDSIENISINLW